MMTEFHEIYRYSKLAKIARRASLGHYDKGDLTMEECFFYSKIDNFDIDLAHICHCKFGYVEETCFDSFFESFESIDDFFDHFNAFFNTLSPEEGI